ncbi:hypothetical protein VK792_15700 [Mesobacterium sp. TK19101]|uniref:PH domain-containing protein n=1 Tax=Mesobacterium hydrothermale TaxID=3111907 RepID=A0ABU6HK71_9RHOB|nr:hypothetical protein [Mesobacterium sp. TK19101]MEC3862736.1 hypothetical protein [Mesobacterium sp. TK19101]
MKFTPDRQTYIRSNTRLAAGAMVIGVLALWLMGDPHVWTGAIGGLAAIALRGWYLMDEALAEEWELADGRLTCANGRIIALAEIEKVRTMWGLVQVVTKSGDKYLLKNMPDPERVASAIDAARR